MASIIVENLRLKDKVAIVTGGCNGIGRACVDVFVENGGKVVVLDIDDKTGNGIKTKGPGEILFIHCDVRKEDDLKNAIDFTIRKYGKLDCLLNNAGEHPGFAPIDVVSTSHFKDIMDLNLVPYFVAMKESLPHLRKTKGSIINMTSMSGVHGQGFSVPYATSKAAIAGLTRSVACDEGKTGVRINAYGRPGLSVTRGKLLHLQLHDNDLTHCNVLLFMICVAPGPTNTPMIKTLLEKAGRPEMGQAIQQYSHFNRLCKPREVAQLCLFLANKHIEAKREQMLVHFNRLCKPREVAQLCLFLATDATFITGEVLPCSGGSASGFGLK